MAYREQKPKKDVWRLRPIRPLRDASVLIEFGRDLYRESLGTDSRFFRDYGRRGQVFPFWIAQCAGRHRDFATMLESGGAPIGMAVLGENSREAEFGQLHHLYVAPDWRGQGFGGLLEDHARETLSMAGFARARLNVTTRNARARRFYAALGWRETGASQNGALRYMEVDL
ncbi:MAG: GNAT family N-acetyltransferase [Pseudomonadota bacterium]